MKLNFLNIPHKPINPDKYVTIAPELNKAFSRDMYSYLESLKHDMAVIAKSNKVKLHISSQGDYELASKTYFMNVFNVRIIKNDDSKSGSIVISPPYEQNNEPFGKKFLISIQKIIDKNRDLLGLKKRSRNKIDFSDAPFTPDNNPPFNLVA